MARDLTANVVNAITGEVLRPLVFFEGVFESGTLNLFSGTGQIVWDGKTWLGGGDLVGLGEAEEVDGVEAVGITVSLNAMDSALIATALGEVQQGARGTLWLGFLDETNALIDDPAQIFSGRLDQPTIQDGGETATISVAYENHLIDLERARVRRFTDADQKAEFAGDRGFEFVEQLQNAEIIWGRR